MAPPERPRSTWVTSTALGLHLGTRGVLPKLTLGIAACTSLGMAVVAVVVARHGRETSVADTVKLSTDLLAWGVGVMLAFLTASKALRSDAEQGVVTLARLRGLSLFGYVVGRTAGLALLLFATVAGGAFLPALVGALAAPTAGAVVQAARALAGALVYGAAYALTMATVCFAALGPRSRFGGYLALLALLVVPELVSEVLPRDWAGVATIPGALGKLRECLVPGKAGVLAGLRATAVLALVVATSLLVARRAAATAEAS